MFKKAGLTIIAHKSTSLDDNNGIYNKMRKILKSFYATNSGQITFEEFKQAFSNHQFSEKDLLAMFNSEVSLAIRTELHHIDFMMLCRLNQNYLHFILHMHDTFSNEHVNYTEFLAATM